MSRNQELIERAKEFAIRAHDSIGHRRKYTQLPYHVHLVNVADIVSSVTDDPEMIAAAWLHDVVEDTPVSLQDVHSEFGEGVAELVESLTDISRPEDGNRATRRSIVNTLHSQAHARKL